MISGGLLPKLLNVEVNYHKECLNLNCKVDSIRMLFRLSLLAEIYDLITFSPITSIAAIFPQGSNEADLPALTENGIIPDTVKPGQIDVEVGRLQIQLAADNNLDRLLSLSVSGASIITTKS